MNLSVEVITTREGLEPIEGQWNSVLEASESSTIFLTWEWISAWLDVVRPDARVFVVVVRDTDARLIAIAPFYRTRLRLLGLVPYRCLRVIGDCDSGAEYPDVIIRRGFEDEAMSSVLAALLEHREMWDCVWLPNMGPSQNPAARLAATAHKAGFRCRFRAADFASIQLPNSFDHYLLSLPRKIRYQMRRGLERLIDQYAAALVPCDRAERLDHFLEDLFRLHQARWADRGQPGVFSRPGMREFYQALGPLMLKRGWLRLDTLHVDGHPVAAQIGFVYHGVFYELQRGIDPAFPNLPAGLGAALRSLVIRRCVDEGIKTYDFLGAYTKDKKRAGAKASRGRDLMVVRPSLRNNVLLRLDVWPTGRFLKEKRPAELSPIDL